MSNEIFELKREQYLAAVAKGRFADRFDKTHSAGDAMELADGAANIKCAGRVVALRTMGKALFASIYDFTGRVQIYLGRDKEKPEAFDEFTSEVSIGDFAK